MTVTGAVAVAVAAGRGIVFGRSGLGRRVCDGIDPFRDQLDLGFCVLASLYSR